MKKLKLILKKSKEIIGHAGAIYACITKGDYIYTGSSDKYLTRWRISDGSQDKFAIKFNHSVYAMNITKEEFLVVGLSNGALHFFDINKRKEIKFYTQHKKGIFSIEYNLIRDHIYVADADGNLSVWESDGRKLLIYLPLGCGKVRSIDIFNDGSYFALACQDGNIRVFESEYFNEVSKIYAHKEGASSLLFHPLNNNQLISGGKDALLKLWDWRSGKELKSIAAHNYAIYRISSIKNGELIVTASRDKNIKLWDSSLNILRRIDYKQGGHNHSVNDLCTINENTFVSCSDDKRIIVWNL